MKKSRFSEAQMVGILKEVELGAKVGETSTKHGVSEATRMERWPNRTKGVDLQDLAEYLDDLRARAVQVG